VGGKQSLIFRADCIAVEREKDNSAIGELGRKTYDGLGVCAHLTG
jgi:hypothetical protein